MKFKIKKQREKLCDLWLYKELLDVIPTTQSIKEKIDELDLSKMKNLCPIKGSILRMKRHTTDWEKIFAIIYPTKGLYLGYKNNSCNSIVRKEANQLKKSRVHELEDST